MSEVVQGTEEWFAERAGYASASNFDKVLAKGRGGAPSKEREKYAVQLATEIITGKPLRKLFKSESIEKGHEREPFARMFLEERMRVMIKEVGFVKHATMRCGASPDGLIGDDEGAEFKCPDADTHFNYLGLDKCPDEYVHQVQGNLWVTGRKVWNFASYHPDFPEQLQLKHIRVERDEEYIANLEKEMKIFLAEVSIKVQDMNKIMASIT